MNNELPAGKNTGIIEVMPRDQDFKAGGETAILADHILESADWKPFLPTDEKQLLIANGQAYLETNACTNFSGDNVLETYANLVVKNWPQELQDWLKNNGYFDANGKLNFSDRFNAKMSKTDPNNGNTLPAGWDSRRHDGMVPESLWPMPVEEMKQLIAGGNFTHQDVQNLYYKDVPQAVIDLGKEFAKRVEVLYEFVAYPGSGANPASLREALKVGPLQIATAVCQGWNTDNPIKACGAGTQHATMLVNVQGDDSYEIYDHYQPFVKHFGVGYTITYAMRGVMRPKTAVEVPAGFHYTFTKSLAFGNQNDAGELKALQQALQYLKDKTGQPYMRVGVFGPYGPQTAAAVGRFQKDEGIMDSPAGYHFGPQTRAKMNARLAK